MSIIQQIVSEIIDKFIEKAKINDTTVNADELYESYEFVKNMCKNKEKELFTYKLNKMYNYKLEAYEEKESYIRKTELFKMLHNFDEFIKDYINYATANGFIDSEDSENSEDYNDYDDNDDSEDYNDYDDNDDFIEHLNEIYEEKCRIYDEYMDEINSEIDYDPGQFSRIFYETIQENIPESVEEWIEYIFSKRTDIKKIYIDCRWGNGNIIMHFADNNDKYIYDIIGKYIRKIKDVSTVKLRELLSRESESMFEKEFYKDSFNIQYAKIIKYLYENL